MNLQIKTLIEWTKKDNKRYKGFSHRVLNEDKLLQIILKEWIEGLGEDDKNDFDYKIYLDEVNVN